MKISNKIILTLIVLLALCFRIYNINWDSGYHLHPDERAIVLYTVQLQFPNNISEFFKTTSSWNPHFFAYGSLPLYLLKIIGNIASMFNPQYETYQEINILGRLLAVFFDLGTLYILFLLVKKLYNDKLALLSAFFYAVSTLPIQLSHFYTVDPVLTFFLITILYLLLNFYTLPSIKQALMLGVFMGFAFATKNSASVILVALVLTLSIDFLFILLKNFRKPNMWLRHIPHVFKNLYFDGVVILAAAFITYVICEPYALIDFAEFMRQNAQQYQMTHNAFTFPYTLQYVGKIPYLYELKNILFFGLGIPQALLMFTGFILFTSQIFKPTNDKSYPGKIILWIFCVTFFAVVGSFAIGFMRYLLPLYPLFALFSALSFYQIIIFSRSISSYWYVLVVLVCIGSIFVWPSSFLNIYTHPNTRIQASNWINQYIPAGSNLGIEHWDDSLPLFGQQNYQQETLELYNPDTSQKWEKINAQLKSTDYIILASNRLYVPLQKLTDCKNLPVYFCYPITANYYKQLFNGKLGFKKAAEFSSYPTIPFLNIPINDLSADESFTVYDHPKIFIFKKDSIKSF